MPAVKQRLDKQKEKEKKEKIVLAGLLAVLVVVGAIEVPNLMKKRGTDTTKMARASNTLTGTTTAATTPSGGSAASGGAQAAGFVGPLTLPNPPSFQPESGQLSSFGLFVTKDPFGATPTTGTGGTSTTGTSGQQSEYSAAVISINGTRETVNLKASFPASSPVFTLVSISASSVKIGVVGGSFADGRSTLTLRKGQTVVLENTADGLRYRLKLVSVAKTQAGGTTTVGTTTTTETTVPGGGP